MEFNSHITTVYRFNLYITTVHCQEPQPPLVLAGLNGRLESWERKDGRSKMREICPDQRSPGGETASPGCLLPDRIQAV
ncbi:hypothetical protein BHE74_00026427 [Ensete ventricosum]|nr:hypothetical protein BHE74_00026427 [Ensete ventricosum]